MNKKRNRKGFTIVELAIVIAVIAILAAALIPTFSGIIQKAKDRALERALYNEYTEYVIDAGEDVEETIVILLDGKYYQVSNGAHKLMDTEPAKDAKYWDGTEYVTKQ